MKYLILAYRDEELWQAMSVANREAAENACLDSEHALRQSGHLIAAEAIPAGGAVTVRFEQGSVSITEGPLPQAKERLVALYRIEARDLTEAIRLAAQLPQAHSGPIEIRPIEKSDVDFDHSQTTIL